MLKWFATARKIGSESTEYVPIETFDVAMTYEVQGTEDYYKNYRVKVKNQGKDTFQGVIRIELGQVCKEPEFYVPGFMYGHNTGEMPSSGRKKFARMRYDIYSGCPESRDFMVRGDRVSAPAAWIYDKDKIFGIAASPYFVWDNGQKVQADTTKGLPEKDTFYRYAGYTISWENAALEKCSTVGYTLGYENAPWLFVQTSTVLDRAPLTDENCFTLEAGEEVTLHFVVYDFKSTDVLDIYKALRHVYGKFHAAPRKIEGMDIKKAIDFLASPISEAAFIPEDHMYTGFVYDTPEGYTYNKIGSLSWTNGLAVAAPMLLSGIRLNNEVMRSQALECIDHIIKNCMNPSSGLPYDAVNEGVWSVHGWWYDGMHTGGHSSYLCGQGLYYVLKAYEYEKKIKGVEHPEYLDFVKPVLDKVNAAISPEYEYPYSFSEKTGVGLEYNSFGGTWCLAAAAYYTYLTKDTTFLPLLEKSEAHYYEEYEAKMQCYGAPLDTDKAIDSEGNLAYMRALRYLHEVTGKECYLKHLKDAIDYECSFKFCYNSPIQIPPLSTIGWSSCGGTVTSTANPHIHPMSSTVTDEMLYYLKHVEDEYVSSRLQDTLGWGMQTFNTYDGEFDYGKKGWMSERFCYSQGLMTETYPDGSPASTWFTLMAWASASVLEGFVGDCFDM